MVATKENVVDLLIEKLALLVNFHFFLSCNIYFSFFIYHVNAYLTYVPNPILVFFGMYFSLYIACFIYILRFQTGFGEHSEPVGVTTRTAPASTKQQCIK